MPQGGMANTNNTCIIVLAIRQCAALLASALIAHTSVRLPNRKKSTETKETYAQSPPPFRTYFRLVELYPLHLLPLLLPSHYAFVLSSLQNPKPSRIHAPPSRHHSNYHVIPGTAILAVTYGRCRRSVGNVF